MSYILEALKRAERERAQAQNPVAGDPGAPLAPPSSSRNLLLKILIAALAVNALIIAVLVLRHKPAASGAATDSVAVPQQLAADAAPRPGIITAPAPKPPPEDEPADETPAVQEGVSSMDDLGASDADAELSEENQTIARTPAVAAVQRHGTVTYSRQPLTSDLPAEPPSAPDDSAAAPAAQTQEAMPEPAPVEETSAPAQPVASAPPSVRPPPAAAVATPSPPPATNAGAVKPLSEMSAAYQGSFPQLGLQVHVYDPSPQKRFAIIDGTRYREGDSLPQGARIEQIVADGLVIDFRGERVLFPLGRH